MHFDSLGNETGMYLILNDSIGSTIQSNSTLDIASLGDTNYLLNTSFGEEPYGNPLGELLLNSSYSVISSLNHPNTDINTTRIESLVDNTFSFGVNIYENQPAKYSRDILLYKLNADLSQADIDTNTYTYDSLCDHPIVSDTIYLDGCDIITGTNEVPGPGEYYSALKTIPIKISPNQQKTPLLLRLGTPHIIKTSYLNAIILKGSLFSNKHLKMAKRQ